MIASVHALRLLYERFRVAPESVLATLAGKPGLWVEASDGSRELEALLEAVGVAAGADPDDQLRALAARVLNDDLGVHPDGLDVRFRFYRRRKTLFVRFSAVPTGRSHGRGTGTDRSLLPPTPRVATLPLFGADPHADASPGDEQPERVPSELKRVPSSPPEISDGRTDPLQDYGNPSAPFIELRDGTVVPDLSDVPTEGQIYDQWAAGSINGPDDFADVIGELPDGWDVELDRFDLDAIMESLQTAASLAQVPSPIVDEKPPQVHPWHITAGQVVSDTVRLARSYRHGHDGRLAILTPSPGTGKTHALTEVAREEQAARQCVAYAVLTRNQIPEAKARIEKDSPTVRLHVIEGRHDGNCSYYPAVEAAADLGFSPGTFVCPRCEKYPSYKNTESSRNLMSTCRYYGDRIRAIRDRKHALRFRLPPPIILTTHASLMIGLRLNKRRLQGFWDFETILIDEDPTGALDETLTIHEPALTYDQLDTQRQPNAHTRMTRLIKRALKIAKLERSESFEKGFVSHLDASMPDPNHTRDHGSSFSSEQLLSLLERAASSMGDDLHTILAAVSNNQMSLVPERGALFDLDPQAVRDTFPHRYLVPIATQLLAEFRSRLAAQAEGLQRPDFAYRVHLDLTLPAKAFRGDEETVGSISLRTTLPFPETKANVFVGDAYSDIAHYENLFQRFRKHGRVDVVDHKALWPTTSKLYRIVSRAGMKDIGKNRETFYKHLNAQIAPVLDGERDRRVLFYTHLDTKPWMQRWLADNAERFGMEKWAIEHWGSGRGKDEFRDFHTFIAVTEYLPNMGSLVHEANARTACVDGSVVKSPRVSWWNSGASRKGSQSMAQSMAAADPVLASAFQRRAIDELAQAVHRIRPAMPVKDGKPKVAFVFGHRVPLSKELLAATSFTQVVDEGQSHMTYETESLERGARLESREGLLAFVSAREMANAIAAIYETYGCWSHIFAHALVATASYGDLCHFRYGTAESSALAENGPGPLLKPEKDPGQMPRSPPRLLDLVVGPDPDWETTSEWVRTTRSYRAAIKLFLGSLPSGVPEGRLRRAWMPDGSRGREYVGDSIRFGEVLDSYAPSAERIPFDVFN